MEPSKVTLRPKLEIQNISQPNLIPSGTEDPIKYLKT